MATWTRSRAERLVAVTALALAVALAPARGLAADAAETRARELYREGLKAYDLGEFDKALGLYTEAYKLKPLPGFLFNLAQCHRQQGDWERAAFFFGRYIDNSSPKEPNVGVARELLEDARRKQTLAADEARLAEEKRKAEEEEARRKADAQAKAAAELQQLKRPELTEAPPPLAPPAAVEEAPVYKKAWFWVVLGVGAAAVAGGVTTAVVLSSQKPAGPPVLSETSLGQIEVK